MTRPEELIYAVDELPRWPQLMFLGLQHAVLMSNYLVPIVSYNEAHAEGRNAGVKPNFSG